MKFFSFISSWSRSRWVPKFNQFFLVHKHIRGKIFVKIRSVVFTDRQTYRPMPAGKHYLLGGGNNLIATNVNRAVQMLPCVFAMKVNWVMQMLLAWDWCRYVQFSSTLPQHSPPLIMLLDHYHQTAHHGQPILPSVRWLLFLYHATVYAMRVIF